MFEQGLDKKLSQSLCNYVNGAKASPLRVYSHNDGFASHEHIGINVIIEEHNFDCVSSVRTS